MRLAQGPACWALAAACGFGLSMAKAADPVQAPSAGQVRLAEIKVELAWLADPGTFPCQLAVRAASGVLEIGGVVRGEPLHQRVLQLAGDHGRLPVRDKLTVLPGTAPRQAARETNPQLCRAATAAMSRLTAGQATNYEVAADANGQIVVSGCVPSCEEKLKVSRHLSQLFGCTSVVNNLVVGQMIREGRVHTVVSNDCRLTVPGEPSELLPLMPAAPPDTATAAAPEIIAPAPRPLATTLMPVQPAKNSPYTSQLQNSAPPANQYGGATAMAAATPRYRPPVFQPPVIYQNPVTYTPPVPTPTAIARGSTYGGSYNPVPPPKKAPVATAPRPAPTGQGGAIQQVALKIQPATAPAIQPAVATVARPAAIRPIPPQVPAQVKHRIETAFRGAVRDVAVRATPDNQIQIKVRVVRAAEGPAIGKKIINLPELAPYKVDLQMPLQ